MQLWLRVGGESLGARYHKPVSEFLRVLVGEGKATSYDHENETVSMKIVKQKYAKLYQIIEQWLIIYEHLV